jgi:CheY-like chemotaxis protein
VASILFVEDNLALIEELAELLQAERPGIKTEFAVNILDSLAEMRKEGEAFDLVILDVMLPAYPGVPSQDEGIYLAAWILGYLDKLRPGLAR